MHRLTKTVLSLLAILSIALGATACSSTSAPSSRAKENSARSSNYDKLVASQPAHDVKYSPTRETKNFWIDTWGQTPGKLAYVYVQNANGEYGYFVLKGLPVTYCVSLLPPETKARLDLGQYEGETIVQGPSMDGTYSSQTNCNSFYGKDATTGAYVEFSIGQNQSYFLYDQPLDLPQFKDAKPLGPSTVDSAKNANR
ncbi:hypothetical protein [Streptomyces albidoflavus]|uniref:hypothetical protein n=1 Tax=Streptomyces albidoflavus TaxID=1886 RepID=UPI00340C4A14